MTSHVKKNHKELVKADSISKSLSSFLKTTAFVKNSLASYYHQKVITNLSNPFTSVQI